VSLVAAELPPTRAERVALAQEMRARIVNGQPMRLVDIAAELGVSKSTVHEWIYDPGYTKRDARRARYAGTCKADGCDAKTDGSRGPGKAPDYCARCRPEYTKRKWTRDSVVGAIVEFALRHGRQPVASDWIAHCEPYPTVSVVQVVCETWGDALRLAGFKPQRKTPGPYKRHGDVADDHPVIREMIFMHNAGWAARDIAEYQGVSTSAIRFRMERRGITPRHRPRERAQSTLVQSGDVQVLRCDECGGEWVRERRRGQPPKRCPTCVRAEWAEKEERRSSRERHAAARRLEEARQRAAREAERERRKDEARRPRPPAPRKDEAPVVRLRQSVAETLIAEVTETFMPLLADENTRLIGDDIVAIGLRAAEIGIAADKQLLREAIVAVANARGAGGLKDAYYELAAVAMALAAAVPPVGLREPDPSEHLRAA